MNYKKIVFSPRNELSVIRLYNKNTKTHSSSGFTYTHFSYERLLSKYLCLYFLLVYCIYRSFTVHPAVHDFVILLLLLLLRYKKHILTNTHVRVIQGDSLGNYTPRFFAYSNWKLINTYFRTDNHKHLYEIVWTFVETRIYFDDKSLMFTTWVSRRGVVRHVCVESIVNWPRLFCHVRTANLT